MEIRYEKMLDHILSEKKRYQSVILVVAGSFVFSVFLIFTPLVPFRMLPKADRDQFYVYLDFSEGSKIQQNQEKTRQIEGILLKDENIKLVESFMGVAPVVDFNGLFKGSAMRSFEE